MMMIMLHQVLAREQLVYPWTSLVAEFGGCLGLFLGFSFMTLWDGFVILQSKIRCLSSSLTYSPKQRF